MYPMVCQTCGFPIAHLWLILFKSVKDPNEDYSPILKKMNIRDECCRRMIRSAIFKQYEKIK